MDVKKTKLWLARRVGRRGAFLAFLAILDITFGYSLLVATAAQRSINLLLPWPVWGIVWVVVGLISATGVVVRADRLQFTAAAALKGAWGLLYVDVWLVQGVPRGWVSVVIWLAFALTVVLISGWPEPTTPPTVPRRRL